MIVCSPGLGPPPRCVVASLVIALFPYQKELQRQLWISLEIGGLVLTVCPDRASCNAFQGVFYL